MPERFDVAIVGAGIVGCSAARELASGGLRVAVVERDRPGAGATRAAAGILSPQAEEESPGPLLELSLEARQAYPSLVEELRSETGIDTGYVSTGTLSLAFDEADEASLDRCYDWQSRAGLPVERVRAGRIRSLEPRVSRAVRQGLIFPYDHQVDNVLLIEALAASARQRGVRFLLGVRVEAIETSSGRLRGLRVDGERVEAGSVLIAAGCWSGEIAGLPEKIPIYPVRGQMVVLDASPRPIQHVLLRARRYLVPRRDGRILVGSTLEKVGFDTRVTAGAIGGLITHAVEVVPELDDASVRETWAGLRPCVADGLPVVGPSRLEGLVYATGMHRSGILLGPLMGRLAATLLTTGRSPLPIDAFDPQRFPAAGD